MLAKDIPYWKSFFNKEGIPHYEHSGTTIGEYVILIPAETITNEEKEGFKVDSLPETLSYARSNEVFDYATHYIERNYGDSL